MAKISCKRLWIHFDDNTMSDGSIAGKVSKLAETKSASYLLNADGNCALIATRVVHLVQAVAIENAKDVLATLKNEEHRNPDLIGDYVMTFEQYKFDREMRTS